VKKNLYVNGDSWSWLPDLQDPMLWTNIVSSELDMVCNNESAGCGSNSRIVSNLQDLFVSQAYPDLIIIALTAHHRYHLPSENFGAWSIGPYVALNDRTGDKNKTIRDWYFKYSFDKLGSLYRYYREIWQMHELATKYQCPIWFFQAWDTSIAELGLMTNIENIKKYVDATIPSDSFYGKKYVQGFSFFQQQSTQWNYIESAFAASLTKNHIDQSGHPNAHGHRIIADIVLSHIKKDQTL
jgi:hypothetical protein